MTATISFFPVGNGDMTLVETASGKKIIRDCNIRDRDDSPDVLTQLRDKLTRDDSDRLYIDLFIWTHPDEDHCKGVEANFHLGTAGEWNEQADKIFVRGIWASPLVYKRAKKKDHVLCPDAKALNREVKRRVELYKKETWNVTDGEYVMLITESEDDKTDGIEDIVIALDEVTQRINGIHDSTFECRILGPALKSNLDEEEENLGKNHSSIIANMKLNSSNGYFPTTASFLFGGDAEVVCWEHLWQRLDKPMVFTHTEWLNYDVLIAPHHCSWRSLSHDSWKKCKEEKREPKVSKDAHNALSQAKDGAFVIVSSNTILDDDNNPPCIGAKHEYQKIVDDVEGRFKCVDDNKLKGENVPLVICIDDDGTKIVPAATLFQEGASKGAVNRKGSDGYA